MKNVIRASVLFSLIGAAALLGIGDALAHGRRAVGEHAWTVGWADEPSFVGFRNGVQLILEDRESGEPVEGAEKDLRVVVSIGDGQTEPLQLGTVFDSPGEYQADLIPTVPGDYTFRFIGTIDGREVDESWTGSKDGFDEVAGTSDVAFPKAAPSNSELAERLDSVEAVAVDARDDLTLPRVLSVIGIVLGLIALVLGARPRGLGA